MKITNVKNFRNKATAYLKAEEPVLVTRHGRIAGILLPLQDTDWLPVNIYGELLKRFGEYISNSLDKKGISEEEVLNDFKQYRKNSR
jgi:hypothetical protein